MFTAHKVLVDQLIVRNQFCQDQWRKCVGVLQDSVSIYVTIPRFTSTNTLKIHKVRPANPMGSQIKTFTRLIIKTSFEPFFKESRKMFHLSRLLVFVWTPKPIIRSETRTFDTYRHPQGGVSQEPFIFENHEVLVQRPTGSQNAAKGRPLAPVHLLKRPEWPAAVHGPPQATFFGPALVYTRPLAIAKTSCCIGACATALRAHFFNLSLPQQLNC